MGSGTNRKATDAPIIRKPKGQNVIDGASSSGGSGHSPDIIADICIASFDVKVLEHPLAKEGQSVILFRKDGLYEVHLSGETLATLDKKISDMVERCGEMGVRYSGKIIRKGKHQYARFLRTAK